MAESDSGAESMDWRDGMNASSGRSRTAYWIATAGGCGLIPRAPGTAGALLGVLIFALIWFSALDLSNSASGLLSVETPGAAGSGSTMTGELTAKHVSGGAIGYGLVVMALFGLGTWASDRTGNETGLHDDQRIVIDEVVGQLISLFPLLGLIPFFKPVGAFPGALSDHSLNFALFLLVVTGFVLFRLFDIWKPGPIGWTERRIGGGLGVMADDAVAGLLAAICLVPLQLAYVYVSSTGAIS